VNLVSLALFIVGVSAICYGVGLILPAAGFIVGGVLVVVAGYYWMTVSDEGQR
jgi:hypothetical protein